MNTNKLRGIALLISIIILCTSLNVPTIQAQSSFATQEQKLFPVYTSKGYKYVDINGNEILKTTYGYADDFINGVAEVSKEFGRESLYIDTKGNLTDCNNKDDYGLHYRVIKDGKPVDLSTKMKEYTAQDEYEKNFTVSITEYDVGDGFIFKETCAGGAPQRRLFKDGKKVFTTDKWVSDKDVMTIVKYDDEKMFRFSYIDYSDNGKYKSTYIDYNGKVLFTKSSKKEIKVILDDKTLTLKNKAVLDGKTVLIPAGEILKKLGYKVNWNSKTKKLKATKKSSVINLTANSKKATINNAPVTMDAKAKVINKVLYVSPERILSKLSIQYSWNVDTNTITIYSKNTGIQVTNKLSEPNPVLNVYIEMGNGIEKREKETANIIIKAMEEAGGASLTEDQKKQVTSYLLVDIGKIPEDFLLIKVKDTEYCIYLYDNEPYRQVYINTYIRN